MRACLGRAEDKCSDNKRCFFVVVVPARNFPVLWMYALLLYVYLWNEWRQAREKPTTSRQHQIHSARLSCATFTFLRLWDYICGITARKNGFCSWILNNIEKNLSRSMGLQCCWYSTIQYITFFCRSFRANERRDFWILISCSKILMWMCFHIAKWWMPKI